MEHLTSYERIVPVRGMGTMRWIRILLVASYLLAGAFGLLWVLRSMSPYALLLTLLGLCVLVLLTKNFLYMEFEYSFYGGRFSLSKIYGKRRRRLLAEFDAEQLLAVDYDTKEGWESIRRYPAKSSFCALSEPNISPSLLLIWEDGEHTYRWIQLETDDRIEQLLRRANPRACSFAVKRGQRPIPVDRP